MNKMENEFGLHLIEEIKTTKNIKPSRTIKLDDLKCTDETGKSLLEYMLENDIGYYYNLIPGLSDDYNVVKYFYKYKKMHELTKIGTNVYLSKTDDGKYFIEELLESGEIDNIYRNSFDFDKKIIDILAQYNRKDLLIGMKLTETQFIEVLEKLIKLDIVEYMNIPNIEFYASIVDILEHNRRLDLLEVIPFDEGLLLQDYRNSLMKKIIDLDYYFLIFL